MSAVQREAAQASALRVVAALETYEQQVRRLAAEWLDIELYHSASAEIERIRAACAKLPQVSVAWVDLLISHAELVHCLWRSGQPQGASAAALVQQRLHEHLASIAALAERCRMLVDNAAEHA